MEPDDFDKNYWNSDHKGPEPFFMENETGSYDLNDIPPLEPQSNIEWNLIYHPPIIAPKPIRHYDRFKPKNLKYKIVFENEDIGKRLRNFADDPSNIINPCELHFIPSNFWPNEDFPFKVILAEFFQRRGQPNSRFHHKLFNALALTQSNEEKYFGITGVKWLNKTIFVVNKRVFAQLLGIKSVAGSLFHAQGNFNSHGFVEVPRPAMEISYPEIDANYDLEEFIILTHKNGSFFQGCSERDLQKCEFIEN